MDLNKMLVSLDAVSLLICIAGILALMILVIVIFSALAKNPLGRRLVAFFAGMGLLGLNLLYILSSDRYYPLLVLLGFGLVGYSLGIDLVLSFIDQLVRRNLPPKKDSSK